MGMDLDCGLVDALTQSFQGPAAARPVGAPSADHPSPASTLNSAAHRVSSDDSAAQCSIFSDGSATPCDVRRDYELGAEIGAGHFGRVFACDRRADGRKFACKQLATRLVRDVLSVRREVAIMRRLAHRHVLRIEAVYEHRNNAWIVSELCEGGDLLQFLVREGGSLHEPAAHQIMKQLLSAVTACHAVGVVHRDLKPENVMLASKTGPPDIRVVDFGLSCIYTKDGARQLHRLAGTPYYMAPEILGKARAGYGPACDLWSCGVVLYFLIAGKPPFAPDDHNCPSRTRKRKRKADLEDLTQKVMKGAVDLETGCWAECTSSLKAVLRGLLNVDPAKRLTAPAALAHPWLATDGEAAPARKAPVGARAFTALERYARATFFHKRVFHALADTLTLAELAALRKEFAYLDVDGDGFVTVEDLTKVLAALETEGRHASGTALEVEAVVEACDVARDHRISYHEFCVASMHRGAYLREDRVDRLFHEYLDTNRHDAHLVTVQSLKAHGFDDASVADVFAAAKATPGKGISRSAFAKLLRLGAIHGASTRGESHKARSLLGHSLDLTGDSPELGVHLKAVFDHEPAAKKTELEQRLDVLNISATGVRVLAPRTTQAKTKCGKKHYYRPKPVSLTNGHFALSVRQAQIASIERQIEAAIKGGTDTTALEATYLARVEIARDEHRAAAVDLRRRGELHAAMDAFREAKHLDFVYQHRKALVEAGGLGDAPPPPEVIARRRLEAAHARLDAISEPLS